MKNLIICLVVALVSVMTTTPAEAKNGSKLNLDALPVNIIVKQKTSFDDGSAITIYYKKTGSQCEVYSPDNLKDYNLNDATRIETTSFEIVHKTEGRLYRKASIAEVRKIIKKLVNKYL